MSRRRACLAVALGALLLTSPTFSAYADITPSPSPSIDLFKAAQEQYKKDRDVYFAALRDRDVKMRSINATFKSAVDKATTDAKVATAMATTPDQKNSITSARRAAIAAAIVARESAIAALGALPTPPAEPAKAGKVSPFGMGEQKGKQKR